MTKQIVLKLLREHTEEFLSGEAISRQAGVSRAAVWKAVEQLRQEGYGIESVPNRGYRLTRVTARLRPEELSEQFRDRRIGRELLCFDTIDSTNNELKRRAVSAEEVLQWFYNTLNVFSLCGFRQNTPHHERAEG